MDIESLLTDLSTQLPDTLESCHLVIKDLCYIVKKLCQRVDELAKTNYALVLENQQLKERLNLDSHNSSKSPSSDFKKKKGKNNKRKSSGKSSGGQPGHKGHY